MRTIPTVTPADRLYWAMKAKMKEMAQLLRDYEALQDDDPVPPKKDFCWISPVTGKKMTVKPKRSVYRGKNGSN